METYCCCLCVVCIQLSITRRSSLTSGGSSSLDNIFRACSDNTSDHAQSVQLDKQRRSAYTEDFISQLTSPSSGNPPCAISRSRSSGPQESAPKKASSTMNDVVEEEEEDELDALSATGVLPGAGLSNMGPMSFSADNLPMLLENTDVGLSSRWRLLGLNAARYNSVYMYVQLYENPPEYSCINPQCACARGLYSHLVCLLHSDFGD